MSDLEVGQLFKKKYPFKHWAHTHKNFSGDYETEEGWAGGCHVEEEYEENGCSCNNYSADGEGFIEYEILAVVEMPRKYQTRIIYRVTMIDPEGGERRSSKCHTVTESKFRSWIDKGGSSYPHDYFMN